MAKIKCFQSDKSSLKLGGKGEKNDIQLLQALLRRFGYLRGGKYQSGHFCKTTESAIKRFQRFHRLKVDGICGSKTKTSLMLPRCGLPDQIKGSANFVLRGCKYQTNHLMFAFENEPEDIPFEDSRTIITRAFEEWSRVSPLRFSEVQPGENPTFRIGWERGSHGDGDPFDGPGNIIAHAFFPPPCGGVHAGKMDFDEAEKFSESATEGIHLGAVSLHEIGHLLGLSHSEDPAAIMFPTYSADRLQLAEDDINGIHALYGKPPEEEDVLILKLSASAEGSLAATDDEKFYAIDIPAGAKVSLDGPEGADFDLYIKLGSKPTQDDFDYRAWTSSADETIEVTPQTPGLYYILVRSYEGKGDYRLHVAFE